MKSICEKLGIKPGTWEMEQLKSEASEMLEALIDICRQTEDMGYIAHNIDEYHPITVIESATGKTWDEVKELMGKK